MALFASVLNGQGAGQQGAYIGQNIEGRAVAEVEGLAVGAEPLVEAAIEENLGLQVIARVVGAGGDGEGHGRKKKWGALNIIIYNNLFFFLAKGWDFLAPPLPLRQEHALRASCVKA